MSEEFTASLLIEDVDGTDYLLEITALMDSYEDGGGVLKILSVLFEDGTDWRWDGDKGVTLSLDPEHYGVREHYDFGDWIWKNKLQDYNRQTARERLTELYLQDVESRREAA